MLRIVNFTSCDHTNGMHINMECILCGTFLCIFNLFGISYLPLYPGHVFHKSGLSKYEFA